MNKKIYILIILFASFFLHHARAQEVLHSEQIIQKGIELHDAGKYSEAIECYAKVDNNDSNFVWALTESAMTYLVMGQMEKTIDICKRALSYPSEFHYHLFTTLGNAYDEAGRTDEAIKIYKQAIEDYPFNNMLHFNYGITLQKIGETDQAIEQFQEAISCQYYHAGSHFQLAKSLVRQGRIVPALMAYSVFLLIEPATNRSNIALQDYDQICSNTIKNNENVQVIDKAEDLIFKQITDEIEAGTALNKRYKLNIKLDDPITRQFQLLCNSIEYKAGTDNFFMNFYVPLFEMVRKNEMIDDFTYSMLMGLENDEVKNWNTKHKDEIKLFVAKVEETISTMRQKQIRNVNGQKQSISHWFNDFGYVLALGEFKHTANGESIKTGFWQLIDNSGTVYGEGNYNDKGEQTDEWRYYKNGNKVSEIVNFVDGQLTGKYSAFYDNGNIHYTTHYLKGIMNGETIWNYSGGNKKAIQYFVNEKLNGKNVYFHRNDSLRTVEFLINGVLDSTWTSYYSNGKIESTYEYQNGFANGMVVNYHSNGKMASRGKMLNDKMVGEWKFFYENGSLKSEYFYDANGQKHGVVKEYHPNGVVSSLGNYESNFSEGEWKFFDTDSKLHYILNIKSDVVQSYSYFDKKGKVISSGKSVGDTLKIEAHYPTGELYRIVYQIDGLKQDTAKEFYRNGVLKTIEPYTNNQLHGKFCSYYKNGVLEIEMPMNEGLTNGIYRKYFPNGTLQMATSYSNDQLNGSLLQYNELGNLIQKSHYVNGIRDVHSTEFRANGAKLTETFYHNDIPLFINDFDTIGKIINHVEIKNGSGKIQQKNFKGKIKAEYLLVNGLIESQMRVYHINGNMSTSSHYFNNELNGEISSYNSDSALIFKGLYENNLAEGIWTWFHSNGKIETQGTIKNGKHTGEWKWYYENGKLSDIIHYQEGEKHGFDTKYSEDGEVKVRFLFDNGTLISYSYLHSSKAYVPEIQLKNETGKVVAYFANGKKSYEQILVNGWREGATMEYYKTGTLRSEQTYKYNLPHGVEKKYYQNGKLRLERNYFLSNLHGKSLYFSENGILSESRNYYNGLMHGDCNFFDTNGNVVKTKKYYFDDMLFSIGD